jgi:RNA polymerase sigma-B factor
VIGFEDADPETEQGRELWKRVREGDDAAREKIVRAYLPLAQSLARRYRASSEAREDLEQVASLGLVSAIDRYDPDRGIPFRGFATPTILGELRHHFRDKVWTVRVPRSLQERIAAVERASEELSGELKRSPTVREIAEQTDCTEAEVLDAFEASHNRWHLSFERPVAGEEEEAGTLGEQLGEDDSRFELVEERMAVMDAIPTLDDRQREVLRLRFAEGLSQSRIAEQIGCSQMQVSRILRSTLEKLRARIESDGQGEEPEAGD